jgi:MYXO-CTERM domain-containing protein
LFSLGTFLLSAVHVGIGNHSFQGSRFAEAFVKASNYLQIFATGSKLSAKRFALGSPVTGAHLIGGGPNEPVYLWDHFPGQPAGQFPIGQTGFVGFRVCTVANHPPCEAVPPMGAEGWIRLQVIDRNGDGFADEVQVIDAAFSDLTGGQINAGQIDGGYVVPESPEPSTASLGLLAAGAAGILALRRRRRAAQ